MRPAPRDRRTAADRARPRPTYGGRRAAPLLVAILVAALAIPVAAAAAEGTPEPTEPSIEPVPVLGSASFAKPYGAGFGHVEPSVIFNGGDPSGEVSKIHWRYWGRSRALGTGLNPVFKPGGGYYRKRARVELRATKLGRCGAQVAYTRLEIRAPKHPGGKLGRWTSWSGAKTICGPPH